MSMSPEILEAIRRRGGQLPSGAGIPGGQQQANNNMPGNPIAQQGMSPMETRASKILPSSGTQENPMSGAISAMDEAKAGQSQMIIKALTKQLERLNEPPQQA